jgi:predicted PhzF superfamily epimerase YddE/YHI9
MTDIEILRYAAFSADPAGGNPAGVVLDAGSLTDAEMLAIAADGTRPTSIRRCRRGSRTPGCFIRSSR